MLLTKRFYNLTYLYNVKNDEVIVTDSLKNLSEEVGVQYQSLYKLSKGIYNYTGDWMLCPPAIKEKIELGLLEETPY